MVKKYSLMIVLLCCGAALPPLPIAQQHVTKKKVAVVKATATSPKVASILTQTYVANVTIKKQTNWYYPPNWMAFFRYPPGANLSNGFTLLESSNLRTWTTNSTYTVSNPYVYIEFVSNSVSHTIKTVLTNKYNNTVNVPHYQKMFFRVRIP